MNLILLYQCSLASIGKWLWYQYKKRSSLAESLGGHLNGRCVAKLATNTTISVIIFAMNINPDPQLQSTFEMSKPFHEQYHAVVESHRSWRLFTYGSVQHFLDLPNCFSCWTLVKFSKPFLITIQNARAVFIHGFPISVLRGRRLFHSSKWLRLR